MKLIHDGKMLQNYICQYALQDIFSSDMGKLMTLHQYGNGECVCQNGEKINRLFFLVQGKLKVYTNSENGRSLLLRFNKPLSVVGELEFVPGYEARCNVESINESFLIGVKYDDLYQHCYNDPVFLRFLIRNLSRKLYTVSNTTTLNLLYPVENRFASYLMSIVIDNNEQLYIEEIKTSKLTEIATLLGTSYRHLNRVIEMMIARKIIRKSNGSIVIQDIKELELLSRGNLYE